MCVDYGKSWYKFEPYSLAPNVSALMQGYGNSDTVHFYK